MTRGSRSQHGWNQRLVYMISAALALSPLLALGPAQADPDNLVPTGSSSDFCDQGLDSGGNNGVCQTDNRDVYWHMADSGERQLEQADRDSLTNMLNNRYALTDLVMHYDSSPAFDGDSETDWIYQEDVPPVGLIGYVWCNDQVGTSWECDQHYIKIQGGGYYQDWKVTCHETGHATGLTHGDWANPVTNNSNSVLGCLRTPLSAITTSAIGDNNKDQINALY